MQAMDNERLCVKIAVSAMDFLSAREKIIFEKSLDNLNGLALHSIKSVQKIVGREFKRTKFDFKEAARLAKASASCMEKLKISCVFFEDEHFPFLLKEISDAPYAIFFRGSLDCLKEKCVSVVGTRKITQDAKICAHDFSYEAASDGVTVVSGLAIGADGAAHRGALDAFFDGKTKLAKTAAVLSAGIDAVYPACHKKIAAQIIQNGGCLLSEYPPGVPQEKWRFVRRNRICAGLSFATVVIQAPPGSGALITADFALDYNRDLVFHKACFSKEAAAISKMVLASLAGKAGSAAKNKIERRPERYVRDGAAVVKSYGEFCKAVLEAPGCRVQIEEKALF